jgi:predicted TIM-barrel fold metal-dependent hydrolase
MRLITLEEHYRARMICQASAADGFEQRLHIYTDTPTGRRLGKLDDIGAGRLADMDAGGGDLQVLSHTVPATEQFPPEQAVALAEQAND